MFSKHVKSAEHREFFTSHAVGSCHYREPDGLNSLPRAVADSPSMTIFRLLSLNSEQVGYRAFE